jgi:cytidine deaminase
MKKKEIISRYKEATIDELPGEWQRAIDESREAAKQAHAPYSEFRVGSALVLDNAEIVHGSNQENAAYPSGLCAERVALFSFGAQQKGRSIELLAITANSSRFEVIEPVNPCGACVQVMLEFERLQGYEITILLAGANGKVIIIEGVKNLLPFQFRFGGDSSISS